MANNSGVIKDIKESEGNTGIESKKKAFNDIYDVDTHTLLIQTKKSMEAAKILHKQQKNVKRKREKETSKKLTKCMTKYDDAFEELRETVSLLNQIFEKRPRKIQKTMSAREPKRSKHENFDIEKRSDEKFRSSESHSTDNTAMQRQNDRYRTERSRKEKDDASKSLERISDTHVTIDKYKDQNYSLNQEIQQLNHMLKEKEDITKRFEEENNKIRHELEKVTKKYANEREAKENALKRLEDMERDKILIEDQHERFVKQLSDEKFSLEENMKRLEDMERDKCLSEEKHERFVKQLSDEKFSLEENMKRLRQERNNISQERDRERQNYIAEIRELENIRTRLQSELDNAIQKCKGEKATKDDALSRLKETCVPTEDYEDLKQKYLTEKNAKDDALRRLSAIASSKLRNKNPNIADLSDMNRTTKIAEKLSELYDNQWTDTFGSLEKSMNERDIINVLRDILMKSYTECKAICSENYFEKVQRCIEFPLQLGGLEQSKSKSVLPDVLKQQIKEFRKSRAMHVVKDVEKVVKGKLTIYSNMNEEVNRYISSCVEITWLMVVQDPPLVLSVSSPSKFDTKMFREYTKRGPNIDFVVWPALLLHEGGPFLMKGIAQGCVHKHR